MVETWYAVVFRSVFPHRHHRHHRRHPVRSFAAGVDSYATVGTDEANRRKTPNSILRWKGRGVGAAEAWEERQ